jgi:Carbohydrate-binding module 48 (Isoamylase N-terminal domain)
MRPSLLFPLAALALSSMYQSPLYAQAKEYTALHPTAAGTIPKASIISQVLPDRSVIFRLKAPDARQVSVLVGFSNPPAAMAPSYQLKKDNDGLWSTTVGPLAPDLYEVQFDVDGLMIADPGSPIPKPQRQVNTSLLEIPGDPPSKDPVTGPRTKEFIGRLDQLKIPYSFEQYPDQIHSMEVCRPSLNKFIAKLFH